MLSRCLNPKAADFPRYGGRGITVCAHWQESFQAFLEDVGERPPGMTLDRIKVNRGYEPGNVQWASARQQSNNKRTNRLLTFEGKTQSVAQWAVDTGLTTHAIHGRLRAGWNIERVLTIPPSISREHVNTTGRIRLLTFEGTTQSIAQWATATGLTWHAIHSRLKHGWEIEKVLMTPLQVRQSPSHGHGSNYKHGMSHTRLHRIWRGILNRCLNPRTPSYADYGGRGITVCERWRSSFVAFYEDVGEPPQGMSLHRRNNDCAYEPSNVVWATTLEQNNHKRSNRLLLHAGRTQSVAAWAAEVGIPITTLHGRLSLGWALDRALTTPLTKKGERHEQSSATAVVCSGTAGSSTAGHGARE